jgi:hypothetical protein
MFERDSEQSMFPLYGNDGEEIESYRVEAPVPIGKLQALLVHMGITTAPMYRIKGVPCSGRVEYRAIAEIFSESKVIGMHQGPAFWASSNDVVADAAWQAITSWRRHHQDVKQGSMLWLMLKRSSLTWTR